jgi:hypothetical protein
VSKEIERRLCALESALNMDPLEGLSPEQRIIHLRLRREFEAFDRLLAKGDVEAAYEASPIMASYRGVFEKLAVDSKKYQRELREMAALCAGMDELGRGRY